MSIFYFHISDSASALECYECSSGLEASASSDGGVPTCGEGGGTENASLVECGGDGGGSCVSTVGRFKDTTGKEACYLFSTK